MNNLTTTEDNLAYFKVQRALEPQSNGVRLLSLSRRDSQCLNRPAITMLNNFQFASEAFGMRMRAAWLGERTRTACDVHTMRLEMQSWRAASRKGDNTLRKMLSFERKLVKSENWKQRGGPSAFSSEFSDVHLKRRFIGERILGAGHSGWRKLASCRTPKTKQTVQGFFSIKESAAEREPLSLSLRSPPSLLHAD